MERLNLIKCYNILYTTMSSYTEVKTQTEEFCHPIIERYIVESLRAALNTL